MAVAAATTTAASASTTTPRPHNVLVRSAQKYATAPPTANLSHTKTVSALTALPHTTVAPTNTYVVNDLGDGPAVTAGCTATPTEGDCTLRDAIEQANNDQQLDAITFSKAGTITLTEGQLSTSDAGGLIITGVGNSATTGTVIQASPATSQPAANPTTVTNVPTTAGSTASTYTVNFTTTTTLVAATPDTITLTAPPGTAFSSSASDYTVNGATPSSVAVSMGSSPASTTDNIVVITPSADVPAGAVTV
ncbi:MAG TPA: hypothetical protein VGI06_04485, partial [Acidimicrobiales bacterium]